MNKLLVTAAVLSVAIGVFHSLLGERSILVPLFRREDLPRLSGSDLFTKRILRFAWHLTSVAWWGFAAIMLSLAAHPTSSASEVSRILSATFVASGLIILMASRGRHFGWPVFLAIGALCWFATG